MTHLLEAERELLAESHRHGVYLALCGQVLAVSELDSSCEELCERMVTYCPECVRVAAKHNAEAAGLALDSSASGVGR